MRLPGNCREHINAWLSTTWRVPFFRVPNTSTILSMNIHGETGRLRDANRHAPSLLKREEEKTTAIGISTVYATDRARVAAYV